MSHNFYITGLPRSRTAWFAAFFMSDDCYCHHEALNGCYSEKDYKDRMNMPFTYVGNSDCGISFKPELIDGPLVIIERDPEEVIYSLSKIFDDVPTDLIYQMQKRLDLLHGLRIPFDEINDHLETIWSHCTKLPFNEQRAFIMADLNIQTNDFSADMNSFKFIMGGE